MPSAIKLPPYIPLWKGKAKIPKDLEATKSAHQTPLLSDKVRFEGLPMGRVPNMKFEDWDLIDHEQFPHLETKNLMKQNTEGVVITLE